MIYKIQEIRRTNEFAQWLKRLKDAKAKARIELRIDRIELTGNLGDFKFVGDGVYELRIDYGPGYRIYYTWRGEAMVLLLVGGDKSNQAHDIVRAKRLNEQYL